MNPKELAREKRKQSRLEKLGTQRPVCCQCGERDDRCLEAHHIAGRAYADDTVIVCRNCHRKLSDAQNDHPHPTASDPATLERIGHLLLGLADFFILLAQKLTDFGLWLIEHGGLAIEAWKEARHV